MSEDNGRGPANERQVGGSHYRSEIQHWDYVVANEIPYLEAQVIKYLTRWRKKNGLEDVYKARHYLDKLIEVEEAKTARIKETGNGPTTEDHVPSPLRTGGAASHPVPSVSLPPRWEGNSGPETDES